MSFSRIVEIAKNIYWVGGRGQQGGLNCNPYLLVDEEEALLIDPGSVLDFEDVLENVLSIVPLEKIKYVILHHVEGLHFFQIIFSGIESPFIRKCPKKVTGKKDFGTFIIGYNSPGKVQIGSGQKPQNPARF